jgi:hypothetical protein
MPTWVPSGLFQITLNTHGDGWFGLLAISRSSVSWPVLGGVSSVQPEGIECRAAQQHAS